MKANGCVPKNDKLKRNLKKLFKTQKINLDDETNGAACNPNPSMSRKRSFVSEPLPRDMGKKYKKANNSTEVVPKKKKNKHGQSEPVQRTVVSPKLKKKSNVSTKSTCTERNPSSDESKTNHSNDKSTKTSKVNSPKKQTPSLKNKVQFSLPLVNYNEIDEVDRSETDVIENFVTNYNGESSSDDDYEYFGSSVNDDYSEDSDEYFEDSGSEDYSQESDEYFDDIHSPDYEYSDYSDYEHSFPNRWDCSSESDPDYELPENVPEDLVIHKGTAQKRDLTIEDDIHFDSDNDDPQIIEMSFESNVKEIKQPEVHSKIELHNVKKSVGIKQNVIKNLDLCSDTEKECPALVPIIDEEGFELYKSGSDSGSYHELSDNSSISEEDINLKYSQCRQDCESDCEMSPTIKKQKQPFRVDIINVKNCTPQKPKNIELVLDNGEDKTEAGLSISAVNEVTENQIITVNICNKTSNMSETFYSNTTKNQKLVSSLTLESESRDTKTMQATQAAKKKTDIGDCENSLISSVDITSVNDEPTNELPSPKQAPTQNTQKTAKETLTSRTIFINAVNSNIVLVLVKDPFYLYGTVNMTLLAGKVEIYGYKPYLNEECEIFSPRGCSKVQIACIPSGTEPEACQIAGKLKTFLSSFSSFDLQRIENDFESGQDAILLLKRNTRRTKVKKIFRNYMNENVFPNMNSIQRDRPFYTSEYQLDCVINIEAERCLKVSQEWQNFSFTTSSKVLLAGGKSVGKSTLLRYLLNTHLEHCKQVLVIDLDIGQTELFVPQTVSCTVLSGPLLGPGFFLNLQPTRAYVVGHSNIVLCAHAYMRAVKNLIDFCYSKEEFSEMPWLINTMGYNKGFGMELMSVLVQLIKPTDIIQLQSNKEINNFEDLLYPHVLASTPCIIYTDDLFKEENVESKVVEYRLHVSSSAILQASRYQRDWEMSAKDLRYATFLSRLSAVLQGNAEWLTDCVPLSASIKELHLVDMTCNKSTRQDLILAIEANLVYLCQRDEENSDVPLQCFGIGLYRTLY
ncbi:polynucleotide 5'-hydroxyl-kinase NOL9 isoform X2 [Eurosta solidaginis]|uniref:polynucleotide 5'-hydroxyl-kinase NOL9 isoform X2 n=1 Tax=Eurosta solidaginis TaxID=178769 RepID=UPI003530D6A4